MAAPGNNEKVPPMGSHEHYRIAIDERLRNNVDPLRSSYAMLGVSPCCGVENDIRPRAATINGERSFYRNLFSGGNTGTLTMGYPRAR